MWTPATRRQHSRKNLRYETDLTDEEWAIIAPYLPGSPVRGRPHKWSMREIVNAIFYACAAASPGAFWSLPLRRLHHAPRPAPRPLNMISRMDSEETLLFGETGRHPGWDRPILPAD